jgi:hypothetical protein
MKSYIYVLKCPETKAVRYVGKAENPKARLRQHLFEARKGLVKSHKCSWLRSLTSRGLRPIMEIDTLIPAGVDWKSVEVERVSFYRSIGCRLTNATDGGDEPGELTEEGRKILSSRASALFGSEEGRAIQSSRMKDLCKDPDFVRSRAEAAKAKRSTPEYKARMSAKSKARWADPEWRERWKTSRQKVIKDPVFQKRHSDAVKKATSSDEYRASQSKKARLAWSRPDVRQRQASAIRRAVGMGSKKCNTLGQISMDLRL